MINASLLSLLTPAQRKRDFQFVWLSICSVLFVCMILILCFVREIQYFEMKIYWKEYWKRKTKKKLEEKYDKSSWNSNVIKKWKIVDDFVRTYVIMAIQMNRMISSACESNSQKPTVPKQSSIQREQSFLYHWSIPLGLY